MTLNKRTTTIKLIKQLRNYLKSFKRFLKKQLTLNKRHDTIKEKVIKKSLSYTHKVYNRSLAFFRAKHYLKTFKQLTRGKT